MAAPGLRIWGGGVFEGQTHIFGRQDRFFPIPLSQDFCPPPGDSPPSQKGAIFLGIPPPGRMPQEYRPPLGYSPPIYAMWFIHIISRYFHLISALLRPIQTGPYLATRREFSVSRRVAESRLVCVGLYTFENLTLQN